MNDRPESILQLLQPRGRAAQSPHAAEEFASDSVQADEYTAFALGRVSQRPQMMLVLRKCTGEVTAFAYSLLTRVQATDPTRGFVLTFGEAKVQIEGENLAQLFSYVCQHRAMEIVEADRATKMCGDLVVIVSRLLWSGHGTWQQSG